MILRCEGARVFSMVVDATEGRQELRLCTECRGWFGRCFVPRRTGSHHASVGVGGGDLFDILIRCEIHVSSFPHESAVLDFEVEFQGGWQRDGRGGVCAPEFYGDEQIVGADATSGWITSHAWPL